MVQAPLQGNKGLYKGDKFQDWIQDELDALKADTLGKLKDKCQFKGVDVFQVGPWQGGGLAWPSALVLWESHVHTLGCQATGVRVDHSTPHCTP